MNDQSDQEDKSEKSVQKGRPKISKTNKARRRKRVQGNPQEEKPEQKAQKIKSIQQVQQQLNNEIMSLCLDFNEKVNLEKGFCFVQKFRKQLRKQKKILRQWKSEQEARFNPERQKKSIQNQIIQSKLKFRSNHQQQVFENVLYESSCIFDFQASRQFFTIMCQLWKISHEDQERPMISKFVKNIKSNEKQFPMFSLTFTDLIKFDLANHEQNLSVFFQKLIRILKEIIKFFDQ